MSRASGFKGARKPVRSFKKGFKYGIKKLNKEIKKTIKKWFNVWYYLCIYVFICLLCEMCIVKGVRRKAMGGHSNVLGDSFMDSLGQNLCRWRETDKSGMF